MGNLSREDIEAVASQDEATLAAWWCTLNRWEWPDGLPNPRVGSSDRDKGPYEKDRRSYIMEFIHARIGEMAVSWMWNSERMTFEDHQDWFCKRFMRPEDQDRSAQKED